MKQLMQNIKERTALYNLNSLDKNVRRWLGPGKVYTFKWARLKHTDRENVLYMVIQLLEAGRTLTAAEQDSAWRLVAQIYSDHALQIRAGLDRLQAPGWAPPDRLDAETDRLRDRLEEFVPSTLWFNDFLVKHHHRNTALAS